MSGETSDGSKAGYYDLPEGAKQLGDLIAYRNLNHADGEMFCAIYRKGRASHSDALRDARKVLYYAQSEVRRLEALQQTRDEKEFPLVAHALPGPEIALALRQLPPEVQVMCFSHTVPTPPGRMTWQDVAKLSAVHPGYIRAGDRWFHVVPEDHPNASGSTIYKSGVYFMVHKS